MKRWIERQPNVISVTIEHGLVKLLLCRSLEVVQYRVLPVNPQFFRESLVSNRGRIAAIVQNALKEMDGVGGRVVGAVPGFQSSLRVVALPRAPGLDPKVVIPQEAGRLMGVSPQTSYLTWHPLPAKLDQRRWLVLAASRRSIASLQETAQMAGIKVTAMEMRPFALARAVNQPEAIIAWLAPDGCDVVLVKEWMPVACQSIFWGSELVEGSVLVTRLTEILGRTIAAHEETSLEGPLSDEVSLYVCGSPMGREPDIAAQVAENLGRSLGELAPPLVHPADFPTQDLIVNMGLTLGEA